MSWIRCGLRFREVEESDLAMLRDMRNHVDMAPGRHTVVGVQTIDCQLAWYQTLDELNQAFIVVDDDAGYDVGLLRFTLDYREQRGALTGTDVWPGYQGQGYGRRILRAGAEYLLNDLGLHSVTAEALDTNLAAQHIISACGFVLDATLRERVWRAGKWHNWYVYSLLQGELK